MALELLDVCKFIAAVFLPPLGVFLEVGVTRDFWINIILTILGWIPGTLLSSLVPYLIPLFSVFIHPGRRIVSFPGVVHAFFIILKY
jgi:uncharacterized membrane protein YqaE (UPF0057 family)